MALWWCCNNVGDLPSSGALKKLTVVLVSITLGILASFWIEFGTQYIGGTRCAPDVSYTGGTASDPSFEPYTDVGPNGCTGQSEASWRFPLALQILPALILGVGMLFYPESPRYYLMRQQESKALHALARIRRADIESEDLCREYLAVKAEVLFEQSYARDKFPGKTGVPLYLAQYVSLVSSVPSLKRLAVGCVVMFFQQVSKALDCSEIQFTFDLMSTI